MRGGREYLGRSGGRTGREGVCHSISIKNNFKKDTTLKMVTSPIFVEITHGGDTKEKGYFEIEMPLVHASSAEITGGSEGCSGSLGQSLNPSTNALNQEHGLGAAPWPSAWDTGSSSHISSIARAFWDLDPVSCQREVGSLQ